MKRLILFLSLFCFLLQYQVPIYAQEQLVDEVVYDEFAVDQDYTFEDGVVTTVQSPPESDFALNFATFASFVVLVNLSVQFLKNLFKAEKLVAQIISWLMGLILALIGWYFNLGFLSGLEIWLALLYGFGASLVSNGVFDTGLVSWFLSLFHKKEVTNVTN